MQIECSSERGSVYDVSAQVRVVGSGKTSGQHRHGDAHSVKRAIHAGSGQMEAAVSWGRLSGNRGWWGRCVHGPGSTSAFFRALQFRAAPGDDQFVDRELPGLAV